MPRCPVCGSPDARHGFTSRNGYPILRCLGCGIAYTDDRGAPPPEDLYPAFDQSSSAAAEAARSLASVFLRKRERVVRSFAGSGRILDFGCGNGAFARRMADAGFEAVGLEPFSLGEPVSGERLTLLRQPLSGDLGRFDVITLWHVLEHLRDPVGTLEKLRGMLDPGGVLVVSVPNLSSVQARLFRGGWFHLDPPRHLVHFEPASLRGCLYRAGLRTFAERRLLPEYGSSGWVQSVLNLFVPHPNLLYEFVKDRGALAGVRRSSMVLQLAASVTLGVPVLAGSIPAEAAAAVLGAPAALTYAARAM